MSREIKFRAWDTIYNRIVDLPPGSHRWTNTALIPMQYTGLTDKNGAEIYEGDIIKFQLIARPAETYVVEWGHFGFTYKKPGDDGDHYLQQAYLEVIGNIYENEDLL